jgi:DNA-binding beta-propeller fold protein YncE
MSAGPSGPNDTGEDDVNDDHNDDGPVDFDLGGVPDAPPVTCEGEGGKGGGGGGGVDVELAYIWISNSAQNTISKINTETMEEEGRYMAKPAGGDPSRTSVNLNGDVAVANRNGGVAKFWANPDDCNGGNTSSGGGDVLAWDDEDCRAWYHAMACGSNRPVAWTRGTWSEATCQYEDAKLWTVCDSDVLLLNGETGDTEQTIAIGGSAFVYGGAADADGNFWGLNTGAGQIFRVDHEDYTVLTFPLPASGAYGITVDKEGRPWVCSGTVARFNLDTSTWSISPDNSGGGGCMTDGETTIWHGSGNAMVGFDTETLDLIHTIPLPEYVHGISVDFAGMVWGVSFAGSNAYRADPETNAVDTFNQLVGAYTYSDMTGFALSSAGGGGVPQN